MTDSTADSGEVQITRRRVLAATGTVLGAGLAGCVESGGSGVSLVGVPVGTYVEGVDVEEGLTGRLHDETSLDFHEIAVVPEDNFVELYTDLSEEQTRDALDTAGVDTTDATVQSGVTAETRDEMLDTLDTSLGDIDVEVSTVDHDGQPAIGFDGADADEQTVSTELSPQQTEIVASYPDPETGEHVTETVLTSADFEDVQPAKEGTGAQRSPHVPAALTDEGAKRYVEVMTAAGFTQEGVGNCSYDATADDEPAPSEHCLLTRLDDEYRYGASMSQGLATVIEEGDFERNPRFVLQTQEYDEAKRLEDTLKRGSYPTVLEFETA